MSEEQQHGLSPEADEAVYPAEVDDSAILAEETEDERIERLADEIAEDVTQSNRDDQDFKDARIAELEARLAEAEAAQAPSVSSSAETSRGVYKGDKVKVGGRTLTVDAVHSHQGVTADGVRYKRGEYEVVR